jgi:hypothetical protein
MMTTQGRTNLFVIASRDFGLARSSLLFATMDLLTMFNVDVELTYEPPSQLLRVPSHHPPGRSVLVNYPELHLAPLEGFTTVILRFY